MLDPIYISKFLDKNYYDQDYFYNAKIRWYYRTISDFSFIHEFIIKSINNNNEIYKSCKVKYGDHDRAMKEYEKTNFLNMIFKEFIDQFAKSIEGPKLTGKEADMIKNTMLMEILSKVIIKIGKVLDSHLNRKDDENEIWLQSLNSHYEYLKKSFSFSVLNYEGFDIFFITEKTKKVWDLLNSKVKIVNTKYPKYDQRRKNEEETNKVMLLATRNGANSKNLFFGITNLFTSSFYYSYITNKTDLEVEKFLLKPSIIPIKWALLNAAESVPLKQISNFSLPYIKFNQLFYINRLYEPLTIEFLTSSEKVLAKIKNVDPLEIQISNEILDIPSKIGIRLIHLIDINTNQKVIETPIIICIHGSAFVTDTTIGTLNYLVKFCEKTKFPAFAIEYRLGPKYQFPCALDDIMQSYLWILEYAEKKLRIKPTKVYFVGESAGSNLMAAFTLLCIKKGLRIPDGLLFGCPCFKLLTEYFFPSDMRCIDEFIFRHTTVDEIINAYCGKVQLNNTIKEYINPVIIQNEDLKQFPKVRICACGIDPLLDCAYQFTYRLAILNVDVFLYNYENLRHGTWMKGGLLEVQSAIEDGCNILKELSSESYISK